MSKPSLKGITWDHSRGYDPLIACSTEYLNRCGVSVTWQKRSLKDFGDMSLQALAQNYDLLIIDHPHAGVAAASECLLPLEQLLSAQTLEDLRQHSAGPSFDSYHYHNHQWALPIDAAVQSAVYRPDLMQTAIPRTWQAVKDHKHLGMALCPTDSLCCFLTLAAQFNDVKGMHLGNQLISTEVGIKILTLLKTLKQLAHPMSTQWNPINLFDYMSEEDDIHYAPLAFSYTNYSRVGYRNKMLAFTNVPEQQLRSASTQTKSAVLGGAGIAVSAQCQDKKSAADYIKWICSAEVQQSIYTQHQGQPGNVAAWHSPQANNMVSNFFNNTLSTLKQAFVRPRFEAWPHFQEHLGDIVHDYLVHPCDEKKVIDYLNEKFSHLVNQ